MTLRLRVEEWVDGTRWRWVLEDSDGRFLADHTVRLDPASREYRGFCALADYLDYHAPVTAPEAQLQTLGRWIGEQVFGGLREALRRHAKAPAEAVQMILPGPAQVLLERPFEIACFADGKRFDAAGIRFVYQAQADEAVAKPGADALRLLAVFSLPVGANPLNLRRERYQLQRLVRTLEQTQAVAVELRVLQYGATRETLREALEEAAGWDVVHLSGHGQRGELLLEHADGSEDRIDAEALGELLAPARERLKLLLLDACYSGAASHAAARVQVGLDTMRDAGTERQTPAEAAATPLPSLGHALAQALDCAVLAMRFPVGDSFATELMLALYGKLLDKGQRLPAALQLALKEALQKDLAPGALAGLTPMLLGARAAALQLAAPRRPPGPVELPGTGLGIGFPPESARFVGRLLPMRRASAVLAPGSTRRAVLFHGMPGAGKSACALELAYRHEQGRFQGYVWYQAPQAGSDIAGALFQLLFEIQRQLDAPDLGLTTALDDPQRFRAYTLPRLRALLEQHALLLVLDNLETLLSDADQWRDPLWGEVLATLLQHNGLSRVVLTSRRVPAALTAHPQVQIEPIHALSFAESVLLARELPRLQGLFGDAPGRTLLVNTLRVVQGHPKLLELADGLAGDRAALQQRVAAAEAGLGTGGEVLDAFFAKGAAQEGESQQPPELFVWALQDWTGGVVGRLSATAQTLFAFLCRLEPGDRVQNVVQANWGDVLKRLGGTPATAALAAPEQGLPAALDALRAAGLIEVVSPTLDAPQRARLRQQLAGQPGAPAATELDAQLAAWLAARTTYAIHPGVAEAALARVEAALLAATDTELGNFFLAQFHHGLETENAGSGAMVTEAARRGLPYLMRAERWEEASTLIEELLRRDKSPDTLAFGLPLAESIAKATAGSEGELENAGVWARALAAAGRREEAEKALRAIIERARERGQYQLASSMSGELANLLWALGHVDEALTVVEATADDTRRAGLGPWTQLSDEVRRLQLLARLGRYDEVLAAVEELRPRLAALPEESDADEAVVPWNVRETLLDTGRSAALHSARWETALALNAEILDSTEKRGAGALERARTRFNDYGPLLRLGRVDDARTLLLGCRKVFEAERDIEMLGKVYSALANLEDQTGNADAAARFERLALGYKYQHGEPETCAASHHNLAVYLQRGEGEVSQALAHGLAAAVLRLQIRSGELKTSFRNLAQDDLPPAPPPFADVVAAVETVEGVRFAALFERLPRTVPDGDAALAAVWQTVAEERARKADQARQRESLAALPPAIRAAFELGGEPGARAFAEALQALPAAEAKEILQQVTKAAGLTSDGGSDDDPESPLLDQLEPVLQAFAAVAQCDDGQRAELEALLAELETKGFQLAAPVQRIWAGERDEAALLAGLDATDASLVRRLLEILSQ